MKVTFIVRLMAALINELTEQGFEIINTNVTEFDIELLEFSKEEEKYKISIVSDDDDMYLKISGIMRKDSWCITGSQIPQVLKSRRPGDHISIVSVEYDRYSVRMTKNYDAEFGMNGVEKNANAIAKDILGGIIAL